MHQSMNFRPSHLEVTAEDLASKQEGGRVFLLPGSPQRAEMIAAHFESARTFPSPRGHTVTIGELNGEGGVVEVGCVSTGMGCPSVGIIVTELVELGVRRLIRVGSAGGLQPGIAVGHVVIATGGVRDEGASLAFAPVEFPAVASWRSTEALVAAAREILPEGSYHLGIIHSKDSLHGREFAVGPRAEENERYMRLLGALGCVGSEMEVAHLFVLARGLASAVPTSPAGEDPIEAACVCGILGAVSGESGAGDRQLAEERAIEVALRAARRLG
jgi:uridine phosphorylase